VRRVLVVCLAAAFVAGGGYVLTRRTPLQRAIGLLSDEGAFDTTVTASRSFAKVSDLLREDGRRCVKRLSAEDQPCAGELAASAWSEVVAFAVAHCTQRNIATAELALRRHLQALEKARPGSPGPSLPPLPTC